MTATDSVFLPRRLLIHLRAVGGQALPLMVNLLARKLRARAQRIDTCETHGMAQRGGVVAATLDVEYRDAAADAPICAVLLGLEILEGARALPILRRGDCAFVSTALILPPGGARTGPAAIPTVAQLEETAAAMGIRMVSIKASAEAPWAVVDAAIKSGAIPC